MFNLNASGVSLVGKALLLSRVNLRQDGEGPQLASFCVSRWNIHCLQITLDGRLRKEAQKFIALSPLTPSWSLL